LILLECGEPKEMLMRWSQEICDDDNNDPLATTLLIIITASITT